MVNDLKTMASVSESSSLKNSRVGMTHFQMVDGYSATMWPENKERWYEPVNHLLKEISELE